MKRGKRPIPSNLRVIQGNLGGGNPVRESEPKPQIAPVCPGPPDRLKGYAIGVWEEITTELWRSGTLSRVDNQQLANYCEVQGRYLQACEDLDRYAEPDKQTHGVLIRAGSNNYIRNPLLRAVNELRQQSLRLAAEFGLTPSSRTTIDALDRSPNTSSALAHKYGLR